MFFTQQETGRDTSLPAHIGIRPGEIGKWMSSHRKWVDMPIEDIPAYDVKWWMWWNLLQPIERRSLDNTTNIPPTYDMDWTCLRKAGNNGLLLVLVALRWWGKASDANIDWQKAAADFRQTLFCMLDGFRGQIAREAGAKPQKGLGKKRKVAADTDSVPDTVGMSTRASTVLQMSQTVNDGRDGKRKRKSKDGKVPVTQMKRSRGK